MTGPAKLAWIITAFACLCAVNLVLPARVAYAAAPRDAIREMPRLSHSSEFKITQHEDRNNRSFQDDYVDTWTLDWLPPPIPLSASASLVLEAHYKIALSDRLNRITSISSDSRNDSLEVLGRLEGPNALRGYFRMLQQDSTSNQYPTDAPRNWQPTNTKEIHLDWTQPGFPIVSVGHVVTDTYNYYGEQQVAASEYMRTAWQAEFNSAAETVAQRYFVGYESSASRNYFTGTPTTSEQRSRLEGSRRLGLGDIGDLQIDYAYLEDANSPIGQPAGLAPGKDATWSSDFTLGLNGQVRNFPLRYQFGYRTNYTSFSELPGSRRAQRLISLVFDPPVPAGKQAGITLKQTYDEATDANVDNAVLNQQIRWSYTLNPRTNGSISYESSTSNNRVAQVNSEEKEILSSEFQYNIPGNRGRVNALYRSEMQRRPDENRRNTRDEVNINSTFQLGRKANITLFYSQSYNNAFNSAFGLPDGNDVLSSGFSYNMQSGEGLQLSANWRQYLRDNPGDRKTNTQKLDLLLSYQTQANWRYDLTLQTSDETVTPTAAPQGYDYATENVIRALVTYTF